MNISQIVHGRPNEIKSLQNVFSNFCGGVTFQEEAFFLLSLYSKGPKKLLLTLLDQLLKNSQHITNRYMLIYTFLNTYICCIVYKLCEIVFVSFEKNI